MERFIRCFATYNVDLGVWSTVVWKGFYGDSVGLPVLGVEAHRAFSATAVGAYNMKLEFWQEVVQQLARVNAVLRRPERLVADVGDLLLLTAEPGRHHPDLRQRSWQRST